MAHGCNVPNPGFLSHAQVSMLDDEYLWMGKELYPRVPTSAVLSTLWGCLSTPRRAAIMNDQTFTLDEFLNATDSRRPPVRAATVIYATGGNVLPLSCGAGHHLAGVCHMDAPT
ncbi:MAG: hypothetical protein R3A10_11910 [Caldilineaceae bacterium]